MQYITNVLGIIDKINELNDKFNAFAAEHLDNVWAGVAVLGAIIVVAFWGIGFFNKK